MGALAEIDAVTVDAYGTLVELRDPVGSLARRLPEFDRAAIERAFHAEARHYVEHSVRGRDEESLARLYAGCTSVFNEALGSSLDSAEYVAALEEEYAALPGAAQALARLRAFGLELAVVGNWDRRLEEHLERLGVAALVSTVVSSAEAGAAKPDPRPFLLALERLGVVPERALHIGDARADEDGARAAGMRFEPVPLSTLPERLR
ncbi:MAG: HAD-IA family hydrolase [Thermoleophilia bacterium]|nr:HAD-IA family hydrolase [Thermoleophilia bacterium]